MKVFRVNTDCYIIVDDKYYAEGDIKFIIEQMLKRGVSSEEIFLGLNSLEHHDVAYYGIFNRYIYSDVLYKNKVS